MMTPNQETMVRMFVRRMSNFLAGQPLDMGVTPIKPSQVRGLEAKLTATGVRQPFAGQHGEMSSFLRGASTIENYAKAARGFDVQNDLLESFCRLLSQQTGESCGIIMGPSKMETSTLKKYWAGGNEASGWQGQFKDLCRCTVVCYEEAEYSLLPLKIRTELANPCYGGKWMILLSEKAKPSDIGRVRTRDNGPEDLGYTDTNISLMLPNSAAVEVQVNIQSTLYGKMGRPAFIEEACPPGLGEAQYASMEQKKRLPGGCGHVLYEVYKDLRAGKQCKMTIDQVRQLSRDYYDHLSGHKISSNPDEIVQLLSELSKSEIWMATYQHTQTFNPRNLPAFRPGTKWKSGDRVVLPQGS
jgi:hypothetical protein